MTTYMDLWILFAGHRPRKHIALCRNYFFSIGYWQFECLSISLGFVNMIFDPVLTETNPTVIVLYVCMYILYCMSTGWSDADTCICLNPIRSCSFLWWHTNFPSYICLTIEFHSWEFWVYYPVYGADPWRRNCRWSFVWISIFFEGPVISFASLSVGIRLWILCFWTVSITVRTNEFAVPGDMPPQQHGRIVQKQDSTGVWSPPRNKTYKPGKSSKKLLEGLSEFLHAVPFYSLISIVTDIYRILLTLEHARIGYSS